MSRRSTPERLSDARRAATIARLISAGELPERAVAKVLAFEVRTAEDGRPHDGAYLRRGVARNQSDVNVRGQPVYAAAIAT